MSERCGRVVLVFEDWIVIKFVGEDEEKYVFPDRKQCSYQTVEGSHLCAEHHKNPLKILNGKDAGGKDVLVDFLGWPKEQQ